MKNLKKTFGDLKTHLEQLHGHQNSVINEILPNLKDSASLSVKSLSEQCQTAFHQVQGELSRLHDTVRIQTDQIQQYQTLIQRIENYLSANDSDRRQCKDEVKKLSANLTQLTNRLDFVQNSMVDFMRNSGELQVHMNVLSTVAQQVTQPKRAMNSHWANFGTVASPGAKNAST